MVLLVTNISWISFYCIWAVTVLMLSSYSIIVVVAVMAMATMTFTLMFYSMSIRVIMIYSLIQELGSIGMMLGMAMGLHLPLQIMCISSNSARY